MRQTVEQTLFDSAIVTGDPPVTTAAFEPPEGLTFEKVGLWCEYTPGTAGNSFSLSALWLTPDGDLSLPSFLNPNLTGVTASGVITVCNPGGAKSFVLQVSGTGTGSDALVIKACTITEP